MERYNIAIVGTGPAGLEAAITAKIRNKSILLLGSKNLSNKVEKAHTIKNYLGLPEISGEDLQNAFKKHLHQMDIKITEDKVNTVYSMGDYFAIQGHGSMYEASTVILACGLSAVKPLPGELENLGRGVSYCATCDGMLYKDKTVIVVGYSPENEKEANYLAEIVKKVIYISMYKSENKLDGKIELLQGIKPTGIEKCEQTYFLTTDDHGTTGRIEADGIFILRESVAPSQLVPGLALDNNHVIVDRFQKTNIAGLFACGDITGAPYQYIKAAGEGNVAALAAVDFLSNKA